METEPIIFLSHSAKDAGLAREIAFQIESNLPGFNVFASTRPTAIPSGSEWFDVVIEHLDKAVALVVLLTPTSENRLWIGFEFGYFWKKSGRSKAYFLYHPKATITGPIANIQGALVTDPEYLDGFFSRLCADLGRTYEAKTDLGIIAGMARELTVPPPERTYRKFIELLDNAQWREWYLENDHVWTCEDDIFYQIVVPRIEPDDRDEFVEPWTKGFPDPHTYRRAVHLRVAGTTIMNLAFISLDGGRFFVPMTRARQVGEQEYAYYWVRDSIDYKVNKIIGKYYLDIDLEAFAARKKMEVVDTDIYHVNG